MTPEELKKTIAQLTSLAKSNPEQFKEVAAAFAAANEDKNAATPKTSDMAAQAAAVAAEALKEAASGKADKKVVPGGEGGTSKNVDPEPFRRRPIRVSSRMPIDPNDRMAEEESTTPGMRDYNRSSKQDREKMDAEAKSAGMPVEDYLALSSMDRFRAKNGQPPRAVQDAAQAQDQTARAEQQTGVKYDADSPAGRSAIRDALRESYALDNPYSEVAEGNKAVSKTRAELQQKRNAEQALIEKGEQKKASGKVYDAVSPDVITGALAQGRDKELAKAIGETNYQAANVESPRELKTRLREENAAAKAQAEATGTTAVLKSETEMSDAAYQRWRDLTTKGTVEDRRAYWTAKAQQMKAEGRNVGVVTKMETPTGEVIGQRGSNGEWNWAGGESGGFGNPTTQSPGFAKAKEAAETQAGRPQQATVPVVYAGAGNNDPVIDRRTGQQEKAFAPAPIAGQLADGRRTITGIYGGGFSGSPKGMSPNEVAALKSPTLPEGFVMTPSGPAATKRDPLVDKLAQDQRAADAAALQAAIEKRKRAGGRGA